MLNDLKERISRIGTCSSGDENWDLLRGILTEICGGSLKEDPKDPKKGKAK